MYSLTDKHITPHSKIFGFVDSKYITYMVRKGERPIATFAPWAFGSCAVHGVYGLTEEFFRDLQGVIKFLLSPHDDLSWAPKELYILLGVYQQHRNKDKMLALPGCKLIDDFDNRSHGGHVYLYRISV